MVHCGDVKGRSLSGPAARGSPFHPHQVSARPPSSAQPLPRLELTSRPALTLAGCARFWHRSVPLIATRSTSFSPPASSLDATTVHAVSLMSPLAPSVPAIAAVCCLTVPLSCRFRWGQGRSHGRLHTALAAFHGTSGPRCSLRTLLPAPARHLARGMRFWGLGQTGCASSEGPASIATYSKRDACACSTHDPCPGPKDYLDGLHSVPTFISSRIAA